MIATAATSNPVRAYSIDGVLVRSSKPIPTASTSLQFLQQNDIPFMLLTNGGGKHESERVRDLSSKLAVPLHESNFVQSHTPFAELVHGDNSLRDKCVMVVGGEYGRCRDVAERYGFTDVVTPGDIYAAHPEIWPFSKPFQRDYYASFARPLARPINPASLADSLKIDAVFVYNDPRDWGLDMQVILDVMLSHRGYLGTYSRKNGDTSLPNSGYLQDGQPTLYFSNADLLWAADYHLSRLGQGGFQASLEGLWRAVTYHKNHKSAPELYKKVIGKPYRETYEFAEKQLMRHRESMFGNYHHQQQQQSPPPKLRKVYMVGDNPESDIRGANNYDSPHGIEWLSLLTRTGVYRDEDGRRPTWEPTAIVDDVKAAVQWALKDSDWHQPLR
ncbi:TIGR01456 family HAD hydrolase [Cladophialophora carrionii CBS 160.54]|uniref:TIGR01456 family HAD hydrolase n=1 Tax=Cladophialophora carrionii CBS 160.54 TaxID=1279043 RepID=V9D9H5_9EURO|nr:TIGR01456 family HAD hydrolase [Cladophialophora carrionii CBS 160.54]ETI23574.1 TIGR01456 family HAD hydrolase [Cladophialophora carrionii CBS 160.54]